MRIFIPAVSLGIARHLALQKWVDKKAWPTEKYFTIVDRLRSAVSGLGDDFADNHEVVVYPLAAVLHSDPEFQAYVLDERKVPIGDADEWAGKCLAAAWAIIQKYNKEVDKGSWQTDLSGAPTAEH